MVLTVVAVGAICWVALARLDTFVAGREAPVLYEVDEAVEFVASALPDHVSAALTYDDVEALLAWHLVHLHERRERGDAPALLDDAIVEDLTAQARAEGRQLEADHVRAVLEAEVAYLAAVGALEEDPPPEW